MDICVAGHGIGTEPINCLDVSSHEFLKVYEVNTAGALHAAQAAGKQMERFGNGGSIILVSSMAGSRALKVSANCIALAHLEIHL